MQSLNTKLTFNTAVLYVPLTGAWEGVYALDMKEREAVFKSLQDQYGFQVISPMPADLDYGRGDMALQQRVFLSDHPVDLHLHYKAAQDRYTLTAYQAISRTNPLPPATILTGANTILKGLFKLGSPTSSHTYIPL
jgi:hypothetical protein